MSDHTGPGRPDHFGGGTKPAAGSVIWLLRLAVGVRGRLLTAVLLGSLASACGVALMATSAWLIARAAQHPPVLYLMVAIVAVRTFGLGRGVLRYAERLTSHDAAFRLLAGLRERLIAHLALIAPGGLQIWRRGDLLTRVGTDVDDVGDGYLRGLLPLAVSVVVGGGAVALTAAILPAAGLALAMALLLACVLAPLRSARHSARQETTIVDLRGRRGQLIGDLLDEMTDVTAGGLLGARLAQIDKLETHLRATSARSARTAGIASATAVLAMGAAVVSALLFGVPAVRSGHLAAVLLAVVVLTPLALTDTVQSVGVAAATLQRSAAAARRLADVLATPPVTTAPIHPKPLRHRTFGPTIALHDVSARWPGADHDAFTHLDLTLAPGKRVVILGPSGSGKSTLLAVLLGFLPISSGRITVDGVDLGQLDAADARTLFAWCDQQPYLFDSTLAENIRLARPTAQDAQIAGTLESAGAGDWLRSLPLGLATPVGEHGRAVSGGQRQRIALARAFLANRPIVLADEPTAHLDAPTADAITALLMKPDPQRCTVLVTHREQDADLGDEIVRLEPTRPAARPAAPKAVPAVSPSDQLTR
ncbi:thiol reductant ABC exporter CydC subunit [Nakamurella sp. UYEF19]|uniref:thiol reductant ABC exporter subunit CydC n=1 Tax=Nakamurella sp. UYEF19 TaxID=1756392 RepID=UPI003397D187